jgi:hypothetical protein
VSKIKKSLAIAYQILIINRSCRVHNSNDIA